MAAPKSFRRNLVGPLSTQPPLDGNLVVWDGVNGSLVKDGGNLSHLQEKQIEGLLNLIAWAFRRIEFLEAALNIEYGPSDQVIPEESVLIEELVKWT